MSLINYRVAYYITILHKLVTPNIVIAVISGIWLIFLGEWGNLLYGIIYSFAASFLLGFVLMIPMIFGGPALFFAKRKIYSLFLIFAFLSTTLTITLISIYCMGILYMFMETADKSSWVPLALWSYGVATAPLRTLAREELNNEFTLITLLFVQGAFLVLLIALLIFGIELITSIAIFMIIMAICILVEFGLIIYQAWLDKEGLLGLDDSGFIDDSSLFFDDDKNRNL